MNVLIIGGMHGNEPHGLEIVKLLKAKPIDNVDALFANKQAIAGNCRFVKYDLNRSFPGNIKGMDYEVKRAAQILKRAEKYDVVLDFHNTFCPDNDCGFVGNNANTNLYDVAWLLGLDKIIVADYDCANKYAKNCLSVEVSLSSQLNNPELWYDRIALLSKLKKFSTSPSIEKYRFTYRITLEDKKKFDLPNKNLKAFQPIDKNLAEQMGVKSPAYPIFIGDNFTPYNYGGLLNRLR